MSPPQKTPPFYGRQERIRRFGIDCGDELLWGHGTWVPGGEYCKTITVKNVGKETVKMKYKPPGTSIFSMDFPEVATLSPGMSIPVQVVFRPVRVETYDDYIEFVLKNKKLKWSFYIPVRARLSRVSVDVPDHVDFGFCPVSEKAVKTFVVNNTGQVPVPFRWETKAPFDILPVTGTIDKAQTFTVTFTPVDAMVVVSKALFYVDGLGESPICFKTSGIGKYPFVTLSEQRVDFGTCRPGESMEKEIVLRNQSFVKASFSIRRVENDLRSVHTISPTRGTIEPGQVQALRITFRPRAVGQFSCDNFCISTPGGNTTNLECAGLGIGPSVQAGRGDEDAVSTYVQFGETSIVGDKGVSTMPAPTRVLNLSNASNVPVRYHFMVDPNAEFEFIDGSHQGVIPALLGKAVTVQFKPRQAGNYYQRVFCAIEDQLPVFFDFLGTAFNGAKGKKNRPQQLLERHIVAQRKRELLGLDRETPERLLEIQSETDFFQSELQFPEDNTALSCSGEASTGRLAVCNQLFKLPTDSSNVISANVEELDFGSGSAMRGAADKKVLRVTNKHHAKVVCAWTVNWSGQTSVPPFAIFPQSQDIGPGQTVEFRVLFQPLVENVYYNVTAGAYVHLKSNRTFRLVLDEAFIPPWHLSVRLVGHTFQPGAEQFLPKVKFHLHDALADDGDEEDKGSYTHMVEFSVCHLGETVFQNILLQNTGDTPVQFNFSNDPSGRFDVSPHSGTIQRDQFQIVTFKSCPVEEGEQTFSMKCVLNNSAENTHTIFLSSFCSTPSTSFLEPNALHTSITSTSIKRSEGEIVPLANTMFIKPTCIGMSTTRKYVVKNSSRVPIKFEWRIPKRFRGVLSVTPEAGELRGNECCTTEWKFTPKQPKRHIIDTVLFTRSVSDWGDVKQENRKVLSIVAEGDTSFVSLSEQELDMGTILTSATSERKLSIINHVGCDVKFKLAVSGASNTTTLKLSQDDGVVSARSTLDIVVTTQAAKCGPYEFHISCQCLELEQDSRAEGVDLCCTVSGQAANPMLAVEDARSPAVSTACLWKQLGLQRLNSLLKQPPTDEEFEFLRKSGITPAEDEPDPRDQLECIPFRFAPRVYGSKVQSIALQIRNTGALPAEFLFRFPGDTDIEIEPWADANAPCEAEVRQARLLDDAIFDVAPREGVLYPGEATTVHLSYKHSLMDYDGLHELDVVLSLKNGRQIRILLQGQTLPRGAACVFPYSETYQLERTPIGLHFPPMQELVLFNPSSTTPMEYVVDTSAIEQLCEENYGFEVLKCLNPRGFVDCGDGKQMTSLKFVFNPLEAKMYSCELLIKTKPARGKNTAITEEPEGPAEQEHLEETASTAVDFDEEEADVSVLRIVILGDGYHPNQTKGILDIAVNEKPPIRQLLPMPGQMASLSADVISFGTIVTRSVLSRLCFLRNQTAAPLSFCWDHMHPLVASSTLAIHPSQGEIAPGSFIVCKFVFVSNDAQIIDSDVRCELWPSSASNAVIAEEGSSNTTEKGFVSPVERDEETTKLNRTESRASSLRSRTRGRGGTTTSSSGKKEGHVSVVHRSTAARDIRMKEIGIDRLETKRARLSIQQQRNAILDGTSATESVASGFVVEGSSGASGQNNNNNLEELGLFPNAVSSGSSVSMIQKQLMFVNIKGVVLDARDMKSKLGEFFMVPEIRSDDDVCRLIGNIEEETTSSSSIGATKNIVEQLLQNVVKEVTVLETLKRVPSSLQDTPLFVDFLELKRETDGSNRNLQREMDQQERNKTLQIPECQQVVEQVLENTVANLMQEASLGEIDLSTFKLLLFPANNK